MIRKRKIYLLFSILIITIVAVTANPRVRLILCGYSNIYSDNGVRVYFEDEDYFLGVDSTITSHNGKIYSFSMEINYNYRVVKGLRTYSLKEAIDNDILDDEELMRIDFVVPIIIEPNITP